MAQAYPVNMERRTDSQPLAAPGAPMAPMAPQPGMPEAGRNPAEDPYLNMTPEQQSQFSQMNPEQREQFIALLAGDFGGRGAAAEGDMSRANAIRQQGAPQGREVGGVYQAANPLQHIASGMERYKANEDFKTSRTARDKAVTDAELLRKQAMGNLVSTSQALRQ